MNSSWVHNPLQVYETSNNIYILLAVSRLDDKDNDEMKTNK